MDSELNNKQTSCENEENAAENDVPHFESSKDCNKDNTKEAQTVEKEDLDQNESKPDTVLAKEKLQSWLNKSLKIEMSDGRSLIGNFLCTDRDANVILGACTEFLNPEVCGFSDEPRILGLVMVPGKHIVSMHLEVPTASTESKQN